MHSSKSEVRRVFQRVVPELVLEGSNKSRGRLWPLVLRVPSLSQGESPATSRCILSFLVLQLALEREGLDSAALSENVLGTDKEKKTDTK